MSDLNSQQQQQAQVPMTPEMIAAIVRGAIPQQQMQMQQPQMTEEQIAKALNRFSYTPELDAQIFNPQATPEQRMALMNQMIRGIILEATTMSRNQGEYLGQLIMEHIDEPLSYARSYGQKQLFDSLYEENPGLKPFSKLVEQLSSTFTQEQGFPKAVADRVKFLGERITGVIRQTAKDFDPKKGFEQQQGQPQDYSQQVQEVFGVQQPTGNQQQQAPTQTQPQHSNPGVRIPAGSSGGNGGGTGQPQGSLPGMAKTGLSQEKPWGF